MKLYHLIYQKPSFLGSALLLMLLGSFLNGIAQSPSSNQNYVMETLVKARGKKTVSSLVGLSVDSANRTIQYLDGLGKPLQTVQWQGSPLKKDMVQHMAYDSLGRETKKYLPYAEQASADGSFKSSPLANQAAFYGSGSWDTNVAKTAQPFSVTVIEPSPLNRVLEQGAPGAVWQPSSSGISGSGHTVKVGNALNVTGEVALWTVGSTGASTSGSYPANTLHKTITRDENWTSGLAGTTEEFKDMEGRVVLKRIWETGSTALNTHYIYDGYGNLCYVVPPAVSATSFSETSDTNFTNYIYGYRYDGRKRVIRKKVPGRGWEHMVYNKLDQVVMTQDSVQRTNSQWSFTKYDALGRVIMTGLTSSSSSRATWQASVDAQSGPLWEARENNHGTDYTNIVLPTTNIFLQTLNFYDDYSQRDVGIYFIPLTTGLAKSTRGLPTYTRVWLTDGSSSLETAFFYDTEGRMVESYGNNHLGGTDRVLNTYNFAGELTSSVRTHIVGSATTTIANTFTYDHMGRKVSTKENINSQGEVVLNKMEYNEIGQLRQKGLHSTNNGASFYQTTKFSYNERGWMKGSTSPEFSMKLGYDTLSYPQYNGNISAQLWGNSYANRFDYQYDKLNRLTNGTTGTGIPMSEVLTYDAMGNILSMNRDGAGTAVYSYSGNQLTGISGGGLATGTYAYDGNGNATTDGRNGITLTYNHLNLPVSATKTGQSLTYAYDGNGQKLKKTNSTTSTVTDYVGGIVYTNGALDFIQTEEGRAMNNGGTYTYQYNLTDHLGNVRYSFDIYSGAVRELQRDDYYAFGKRKSATGGTNKYLYNGKELQDELGQYDYGARFYDPVIGRWNVVDALAEHPNQIDKSPYAYAWNNPVNLTDPDGNCPTCPKGIGYSNPLTAMAEGVRQYMQAAGAQVDKAFVNASLTVSTIATKTKAFFGVGEANVTTSVDVTHTVTAGTNLNGFLTNYGNNTPSEPFFKTSYTSDISQTTKVDGKVTIEGVDVKATNTLKTDVFTGASSNTFDVTVGKGSNGAFVSHKTTATGSQTDVGVKASYTTPQVKNTTFTFGVKMGATVQKEENKR